MDGNTVSANQAIEMLRAGNNRFASNSPLHPHQDLERRTRTAADGQRPYATILTCSDSRVPVEIICDTGVGDVFTVRVAGNVSGADQLGSIEYAVGHLGTPVLVIMGHKSCGLAKAVVDTGLLEGNLREMSQRLLLSVQKARNHVPVPKGAGLVDLVSRHNVWYTIEQTLRTSALVRDMVRKGNLKLIGAFYHVDTGIIEWMGRHDREWDILAAASKKGS